MGEFAVIKLTTEEVLRLITLLESIDLSNPDIDYLISRLKSQVPSIDYIVEEALIASDGGN